MEDHIQRADPCADRQCGDGSLAQRMAQEREILAVLDHPHIARIFDAGVAADGQPYLALEYVEGRPIDAHCREHALSVRQRITLFLQVADAVAHAHAKLVVHRDLKPSNILVTAEGQARLLDFGIAKLVGEAQAGHTELTQNAARVMTPWYAAPEQVRGEPVSTATDTYALGVVLYELLTGERPYRLARHTAAALEDAILRIDPQRPSSVAADPKLAKALRGDLDTIVLKALKKAPNERYATVTALADDLRHWLADRPVLARPDGARYRLVKYLRRNRLALAVVGAVVLSLSAGLTTALWQGARARQEAAKANAIKDYLIGLFETNDIEQRDGPRKRQQSVQQLLEQGAASLGQGLAEEPEVRDELQQTVGRLLENLAMNDAAIQLRRQRAAQLAERKAPAVLQVQALRELAVSERIKGNMAAAQTTLAQALALCEATGLARHLECLSAQSETGRMAFADRRLDAALTTLAPLTQTLRRDAPGSMELADALDLLGMVRLEQNHAEEAYVLLHESIAIKRARWGDTSARLALARFHFGRNLWNLRHLAQAEAELRAAWDVAKLALGPEHVTSARIELNVGRLTAYLGLRTDGLVHVRHAAAVLFKHADQVSLPDLMEAYAFLGNVLVVEGRVTEAGPMLQKALDLRAGMPIAEWVDPTLDQSYARYLLDLGRYTEARAWLEALAQPNGRQLRSRPPQHRRSHAAHRLGVAG